MVSKYRKYLIGLVCFFQIIGLIVFAVETSVFDIDFFTKIQLENRVSENMRISQSDVTGASQVALDYTKGKTDDLTYMLEFNDKQIDLYSSQDKEHMIDVYYLYQNAFKVGIFSALLIIILIGFTLAKRVSLFEIAKIYNWVSLYSLIFVALIGLFAYTNFNVFWTFFHKVFFTNDLWLMNPATDALVNLFPEALFMALVLKILFSFLFTFGLSNLLAFLYKRFALRGIEND